LKFSYNWLRDYVEGLDIPARKLESLITMKTAECEGIEEIGHYLADACSARIDTVEPIAGSHNVKARVETGRYGQKTVVCGAPNCRPGVVTVYVPLGKKVIQGVESDGMLASAAELGISRDSAGIVEMEGQPGTPVAGCVPDSIIEIDNKSITHRPDLWGHHGMAREVAAISRRTLLDPVKMHLVPGGSAAVKIAIVNVAYGFHRETACFLAAFIPAHAVSDCGQTTFALEILVGIRFPVKERIFVIAAL